jgi:hypothetical protein
MTIRWTADKLRVLRSMAERGSDARAAAELFGCSILAAQQQARKLGVTLHKRRRTAEEDNPAWTPTAVAASRPVLRLSPDLLEEIEAIRREWSTAPRYKLRHW